MKRLINLLHSTTVLLCIMLLLAGCGGEAAVTPTLVPTVPTATIQPTQPTSAPTDTIQAATATIAVAATATSPVATATAPATLAPTQTATAVASANMLSDCVTSYDAASDYFPEKAVVEHAANFTVRYESNYKVVTTSAIAPTHSLTATSTLVLVQCGTPAPALTGDLEGALVIEVPVKTVTFSNNEQLAMAHALGLTDRVVSTGGPSTLPGVAAAQAAGKIVESGYAGKMNSEVIVNLDPDLVVVLAWYGAQQKSVDDLRALGLPAVGAHDWLEPTPLGRAEWIKFIALFFNKESAANDYYGKVEADYSALAAKAGATTDKPSALWATPYSADFVLGDTNGWNARLLEDAGATNILADDGPTYQDAIAPEVLLEQAADASYWFTEASIYKVEGLAIEGYRALREGNVYDPNKPVAELGGGQYFSYVAIRPDLMLADLVSIFHPNLLPDHELYFFQKQQKP